MFNKESVYIMKNIILKKLNNITHYAIIILISALFLLTGNYAESKTKVEFGIYVGRPYYNDHYYRHPQHYRYPHYRPYSHRSHSRYIIYDRDYGYSLPHNGSPTMLVDNEHGQYPIDVRLLFRDGGYSTYERTRTGRLHEFRVYGESYLGKSGDQALIMSPGWANSIEILFNGREGIKFSGQIKLKDGRHISVEISTYWIGKWVIVVKYR